MPSMLSLAAAALLLPAVAGSQTLLGRSDAVYTWRGPLRAGAQLSIRNHNGPIDVRPASGTDVEFRAEKRPSHDGAIEDVAFDVRTSPGGDVTICTTLGDRNPCERERRSRDDDRDIGRRDVSVAITVLVPRGAQVKILTGNGALSVERVGGDLEATTGNGRVRVAGTDGRVRVTTGNGAVDVRDAKAPVRVVTGNGDVTVATSEGPVEIHSGNGDLDVRMSTLQARDDMTFSTGNGSVRLFLPASFNGELDASTGNGEVRSDFDLRIKGRVNPRHVRATIGDGGPLLRLSTGSGGLEIRKN